MESLRSFEPGACTINPSNGFDLFACDVHGHRVTTHECAAYRKSGACPEICKKYPVSVPSFLVQKQEKSPETPAKATVPDIPNGLFPIGRWYMSQPNYFSTTEGGQVTHKRCSRCGEIKEVIKENYYVFKGGRIHSECIPCVAIRDSKRRPHKPDPRRVRKRVDVPVQEKPARPPEESKIASADLSEISQKLSRLIELWESFPNTKKIVITFVRE